MYDFIKDARAQADRKSRCLAYDPYGYGADLSPIIVSREMRGGSEVIVVRVDHLRTTSAF